MLELILFTVAFVLLFFAIEIKQVIGLKTKVDFKGEIEELYEFFVMNLFTGIAGDSHNEIIVDQNIPGLEQGAVGSREAGALRSVINVKSQQTDLLATDYLDFSSINRVEYQYMRNGSTFKRAQNNSWLRAVLSRCIVTSVDNAGDVVYLSFANGLFTGAMDLSAKRLNLGGLIGGSYAEMEITWLTENVSNGNTNIDKVVEISYSTNRVYLQDFKTSTVRALLSSNGIPLDISKATDIVWTWNNKDVAKNKGYVIFKYPGADSFDINVDGTKSEKGILAVSMKFGGKTIKHTREVTVRV